MRFLRSHRPNPPPEDLRIPGKPRDTPSKTENGHFGQQNDVLYEKKITPEIEENAPN